MCVILLEVLMPEMDSFAVADERHNVRGLGVAYRRHKAARDTVQVRSL